MAERGAAGGRGGGMGWVTPPLPNNDCHLDNRIYSANDRSNPPPNTNHMFYAWQMSDHPIRVFVLKG